MPSAANWSTPALCGALSRSSAFSPNRVSWNIRPDVREIDAENWWPSSSTRHAEPGQVAGPGRERQVAVLAAVGVADLDRPILPAVVVGLDRRLDAVAASFRRRHEVGGIVGVVGDRVQRHQVGADRIDARGRQHVAGERQLRERIDERHARGAEVAVVLGRGGHVRQPGVGLDAVDDLDVREEERRPFADRTAERAAELVLAQPRFRVVVGQQAVAGVQRRVAEVLVGAALQVARARSHDDVDLAAGAAAVGGVVGVLEERDLLDGVEARVHHEPVEEEIVVVDAVEQEVVGGFAGAGDVEADVALRRQPRARRRRRDARHLLRELERVALEDRQRGDRLAIDHLADGAVARHQRRAIGGDVDALVDGAGLEHDAERALDRRLQAHVANELGLEADAGGGHEIRAGGQQRHDQGALGVGRATPADAAVAAGEHHGDVRHHRVRGITDLDGKRGGRRLGRERCGQTDEEGGEQGAEGTAPPRVEQSGLHTRRSYGATGCDATLTGGWPAIRRGRPLRGVRRRAGAGTGHRPDPR